jgi:hypothetical protein
LEVEELEWQEGDLQEEAVETTRADAKAALCSVPRRSSLTRSIFVADLKSGNVVVLAMMSAVVVNQALRPRRRLRTSYAGETVWPTSRSASAVRLSC